MHRHANRAPPHSPDPHDAPSHAGRHGTCTSCTSRRRITARRAWQVPEIASLSRRGRARSPGIVPASRCPQTQCSPETRPCHPLNNPRICRLTIAPGSSGSTSVNAASAPSSSATGSRGIRQHRRRVRARELESSVRRGRRHQLGAPRGSGLRGAAARTAAGAGQRARGEPRRGRPGARRRGRRRAHHRSGRARRRRPVRAARARRPQVAARAAGSRRGRPPRPHGRRAWADRAGDGPRRRDRVRPAVRAAARRAPRSAARAGARRRAAQQRSDRRSRAELARRPRGVPRPGRARVRRVDARQPPGPRAAARRVRRRGHEDRGVRREPPGRAGGRRVARLGVAARMFLSSTASTLAGAATCPVAVVPPA
jgi:hypothetical protein